MKLRFKIFMTVMFIGLLMSSVNAIDVAIGDGSVSDGIDVFLTPAANSDGLNLGFLISNMDDPVNAGQVISPVNDSHVNGLINLGWDIFTNADTYDIEIWDFEKSFVDTLNTDQITTTLPINTSAFPDGRYFFNITGRNPLFNDINENHSLIFDNTIPDVNITSYPDDFFTPSGQNITFEVFDENIQSCDLVIDGIIKTSGLVDSFFYNFKSTDDNKNWTIEVQCFDQAGNEGNDSVFALSHYDPDQITGLVSLEIGVCPDSSSMGFLWLVIAIGGFLIWIGYTNRIGIIVFLGGCTIMVSAWYLSACSGLLGLIIGGAGVMIVLFSFFLPDKDD